MIRQLSQCDVQTALATRSGDWLTIDETGRMTVNLTNLAVVVHDIGNDMLTRGLGLELAHRYRLLAGAVRVSGQSPTMQSPQVKAFVHKWCAGLERQARVHETAGMSRRMIISPGRV